MVKIEADLVIGADGRHSQVRRAAGLRVMDLGASIDVLWMRIPLEAHDPPQSGGRVGNGHFLAMIHRATYWQCAYVIPKGGIDTIKQRGLDAFHEEIAEIAPFFASRIKALLTWNDIKLLRVSVDRLEQWWKPGLFCIGDAAHAMSPIGGVGINLAIQDAVATANMLAKPLRMEGFKADKLNPLLAKIQERRLVPTKLTQAAQVAIQNRLLLPIISGNKNKDIRIPLPIKVLNRWPILRALPAYAIGVGVRPEHINPGNY
jgi:2-polyprenyl-6-methoxyphenol hydroxylase-like FAD-dependent oxidoreductase